MRSVLCCSLALLLAACEGPVPPGDAGDDGGAPGDGDVPADGGPGGPEGDGGDGPGDGGAEMDGAADDAGSDGGAGLDAGTSDGGCDCPAPPECQTIECAGGSCATRDVADGTACGEMGHRICVAGSCVMRGCGDGYREPGPSPMREGCDDGNMESGDACSPDCVPTPFLVHADGAEEWHAFPTGQGRSVGVDGLGNLLFVWSEDRGDRGRVRARLYDGNAVPVAHPFEVDGYAGAPVGADPVVAGLGGGGWVVVWSAERSGSREVLYRMIAADGAAGVERVANEETTGDQDQARVAAVGDGFVVVWTDLAGRATDPGIGVRARRFSRAGGPLGGEIVVATDVSDRQDMPAIAAAGDVWMVAWRHGSLVPGGMTRIAGRRFDGGLAVDSAQVELATGSVSVPSVATLGGADFAVAWAEGGDIVARTVTDAAGAAILGTSAAITTSADWATEPAVSGLAGGGYVVAWVEGIPSTVAFGAGPAGTLAPEAPILESWLPTGAEGHASVVPAPDGTWFVWAGTDFATGSLGVAAFHLPRD